jgi:hypothetical protein
MKKKISISHLFAGMVLSALFFLFTNAVHQPELSSTMLVEREDGVWVLQVRAALTAFENEVHNHYGKDSYATPEEFNTLVIRHLMENISITVDGKEAVSLQKGKVKLGHETTAAFEVDGIPKKIKKISVSNSSFKDIHDNQGTLIILKKGFKKQRFLLNNKNEHIVQLKVSKNQFEQQ